MYTIQVGSFLLNGQLLLVVLFGMAGWAALRLYLRGRSDVEPIVTIASNAFLIWILVWKGSLLLWDPVTTWAHPISLLYYDGGEKGRWTAVLAAAGYAAWRTRRKQVATETAAVTASVYLLGGYACYHAALAVLDSTYWAFHAGMTALSLGMLLPFLIGKWPVTWNKLAERWLWLMLGWSAVWFLHPSRNLIIFSFNMQQITGLVLATILYFVVRRLERRRG